MSNRPLSIYVENYTTDEHRAIAKEQVEACLRGVDAPLNITMGWHATLDVEALAISDFIVAPKFNTAAISQYARNLKLVHCINAGVERYMPLDWLPVGAVLTNSRGIHAVKAREYALMSLLMLNTRLPVLANAQRARLWKPEFTTPILGKTVVVVGTGGIGGAIAGAAKSLQMRVIGVNRSGNEHSDFDEVVAQERLDEVLPYADFVALACPLTIATRNLFSEDRLALLKQGAGILNMARGGVIDTAALIRMLEEKRLSGAVADVFDQEPLPESSPVWDAPHLIVTPHISCDSPVGYVDAGLAIFGSNVRSLLAGGEVTNRVDPDLQY